MIDETKLLEMREDDLVAIISTHSPTNPLWEGARAALEVKNARRMLASAKRMELATWAIGIATIIQLALALTASFRH